MSREGRFVKKKTLFCFYGKKPYLCIPFGNGGLTNEKDFGPPVRSWIYGLSAKRRRLKFFKINDHVAQRVPLLGKVGETIFSIRAGQQSRLSGLYKPGSLFIFTMESLILAQDER